MEEHKSGKDVAVVTIPPNPMQTSDHSKIDIVISPRAEAATSSSSSSKILMPLELLTNNGASQPHSHPIPQASPSSPRAHPWRPPQVLLIKKVTAEFLGTFILMFTVLSTIVADEQHGGVEGLLGVAASAGLAVMVLVLSIVHISGCHLNPAVSIAMAVFGHLPRPHLLPYMAAQVMGSIGASFLVKAIFRPVSLAGIATVPKVGAVEAFFLEFVITFVLLFVIAALATDPHAVKELIAVAVGAAIMMNALVAGPSTGASMNPVRTIGPAIVTGIYTQIWVYMVATILGAVAGTGAYLAIKL